MKWEIHSLLKSRSEACKSATLTYAGNLASDAPAPAVTATDIRSAFLSVYPWKMTGQDGVPGLSVANTISLALCSSLKHLDNKNTYVRLLLIDYRFPFNTIIPSKLISQLHKETETGKVAQTACMSACKHLSTSLLQLLLDTEVKQITMGALKQFNMDIEECERCTWYHLELSRLPLISIIDVLEHFRRLL
eukprot:g44603.t1